MMLPTETVHSLSYTASWLTFVGFVVGLYECWRFVPLRVFFSVMLSSYAAIYTCDFVHGKNPLVLLLPLDAPLLIYFWSPVARQMAARWTICLAVWSLLITYKLWSTPWDDDEEAPGG